MSAIEREEKPGESGIKLPAETVPGTPQRLSKNHLKNHSDKYYEKRYRNRITYVSSEDEFAAMTPGKRRFIHDRCNSFGFKEILVIYQNGRLMQILITSLFLLLPFGCAVWRIYRDQDWWMAVVPLCFSLFLATVTIRDWVSGIASSNHGVYLRKKEPIRYWINMLVSMTAYLIILFGILFAHH